MGEITSHPSFKLGTPEKISPAHKLGDFSCGNAQLDDWLKRRGLANNARTSQTFVVCIDLAVVGYYTLAAGAVALADAPPKLRRNWVDPIPIILVGRLAVDQRHQRKGLGEDLLRDALLRSLRVAGEIGVRALLVHAIDDEAVAFYSRFGFIESQIRPRTLMLPLDQLTRLLPKK